MFCYKAKQCLFNTPKQKTYGSERFSIITIITVITTQRLLQFEVPNRRISVISMLFYAEIITMANDLLRFERPKRNSLRLGGCL